MLNVRFEPYYSVMGTARIPVTLTRVSAAVGGKARPESRTVMAHLNGANSIEDLSPGTWLVRATLPNGQMLDTSVVIDDKAREVEAVLNAGAPSPNETAAWAYVLQPPGGRPHKVQHQEWTALNWDAGNPLAARLLPEIQSVGVSEGPFPGSSDPKAVHIVSNPFRDPDALFEGQVSAPVQGCFWLIVDEAGGRMAWRVPPSPSGGQTRFLIRRISESPRSTGWNALFDFGNDNATALLSYLQAGSLAAAHQMGLATIDEAIGLIEEKFTDFSSAAAGGYFLRQAADWRIGQSVGHLSGARLGDWLRRMDRSFEKQPDGAIIHGHWLLDNGKGDEAREAFLRAAARGVPIFSIGFKALSDGLAHCYAARKEGAEDEPLKQALQLQTRLFKSRSAESTASCLRLPKPREDDEPLPGKQAGPPPLVYG